MNVSASIVGLIPAAAALLLVSCASDPRWKKGPDGKYINPYTAGTYQHFISKEDYPKTYQSWRHTSLLSETTPKNSKIMVCLKKQRGFLLKDDTIVFDYPICSGTKDRPTPPGEYKILEKKEDKRSNLYGKIFDAEGKLVNGDADIMKDEVPEGGRFEGAPMMYWMRLTNDGVGHHIGPVRRRPSSHGCIRGPSKVIPIVFTKVAVGSTVEVKEKWDSEVEKITPDRPKS